MNACILAEGKQAVARYKSYKSMFLEVLVSGSLPQGKYKHAIPLYKVALQYRSDPSVLTALHTVFRSYDLYTPPAKLISQEESQFVETFMVDALELQQHEEFILMEDEVFDFKAEIRLIVHSQAFREFSRKVPFSAAFKPREKAILLAKHGTATFSKGSRPKRVKGYAPAIMGATAELKQSINTMLRDGRSYYDLLCDLGDAIGSHSWPSMKFPREAEPPSGPLRASLRRRVAFGNPGFKSRIIAIADYTTQYVLSPLHKWAFDVLSAIDSDYTFSHETGFQRLSEFTRDSKYVACFDLSNATDALPVALSKCVLQHVLPNGQVIAPMWIRVLCELPFNGKYYRVGQPMGLLSSWSVGLALTHHFVIWMAASRAGLLPEVLKNPKEFYGIVGDDVYIINPILAHYYSIIMNALGCKINLAKSLIVSEKRRVSEFAKRNSLEGDEISAISPRLIVKSFSDYACVRELILKLRSRVLLGPLKGSASSFDERALVDLYQLFGSDFIRASIGTMCTIPTYYAGLAELSSVIAPWPPMVRINFLVMKALTLLEYSLRSIYINASGQDVYNSLVLWSMEDLVPLSYFPRTQFIEFVRQQTIEAESLLGQRGLESNHLMAKLAQLVYDVCLSRYTPDEFQLLELEFLTELDSFVKPPSFSTKEAGRKEIRSLAFKVYKSVKHPLTDGKSFELMISRRLIMLLYKFKFVDTARPSREELYQRLFMTSDESPDLSVE